VKNTPAPVPMATPAYAHVQRLADTSYLDLSMDRSQPLRQVESIQMLERSEIKQSSGGSWFPSITSFFSSSSASAPPPQAAVRSRSVAEEKSNKNYGRASSPRSLQEENDQVLDLLSEQVESLKSISQAMSAELDDHNARLDSLVCKAETASSRLNKREKKERKSTKKGDEEEVVEAAPAEMRAIIMKQKASGSWSLSDVASLLGSLSAEKIKKILSSLIQGDCSGDVENLWITAVVVAFLQVCFPHPFSSPLLLV